MQKNLKEYCIMKDWDANLYVKFEKERTQPSIDLIQNIKQTSVKTILDVGCGPGNSTEQLSRRWNHADILGIDKSPNMLEQAKKRLPYYQFKLVDVNQDLNHLGKYDLVFSNAVIQWIPHHDRLIKKLFELLNVNGALAVQMPNTRQMGIRVAIEQAAKDLRWVDRLEDLSPLTMNEMGYYYNIFSKLTDEVQLWETKYYHIMDNFEQILQWYRSAGLRPYYDALGNSQDIINFEHLVLQKMKTQYKTQQDNKVLFPFTRMFFILYKKK
jgi:trans-aconitate 2-methyltransferase